MMESVCEEVERRKEAMNGWEITVRVMVRCVVVMGMSVED